MKEWDLDSYIRKFKQTITVFKNSSGAVLSDYVREVAQDDEGIAFMFKDGVYHRYLDPQYVRFEGRYYETKDGYVAVTRRIKKTWKIGFSPENYNINPVKGRSGWETTNILKPLEVDVAQALKKEGPISKQLYLTKTAVLLLDKEVGIRKGSKFMVNESVWQEVSDSLRGFECSIST